MKKILIITLVLTFIGSSGQVKAQTIKHFSYLAEPNFELSQDSTSEVYTNEMNIEIQFGITSVSSVDEVYFNFGDSDGSSSGLTITFDVVNTNGTYYLEYNTYSFEVDTNGFVILNILSSIEGFDDFRFAEVWYLDNQQNTSSKFKTTLP